MSQNNPQNKHSAAAFIGQEYCIVILSGLVLPRLLRVIHPGVKERLFNILEPNSPHHNVNKYSCWRCVRKYFVSSIFFLTKPSKERIDGLHWHQLFYTPTLHTKRNSQTNNKFYDFYFKNDGHKTKFQGMFLKFSE